MKRRFLSFILALLMLFSVIPAASASDHGLYIVTLPVPDGAIEYAELVAPTVAYDYTDLVSDTSLIELGTPFTFNNIDSDIYYFPIMFDGAVLTLLRVCEDEGIYYGIFSEFLVDDLEKIAAETSYSEPLSIYMDDNVINFIVADDEETVFEYPEEFFEINNAVHTETLMVAKEDPQVTVVNAMEAIADVEIISENDLGTRLYSPLDEPWWYDPGVSRNVAKSRNGTSYESYVHKEKQGSQSWCTAFAAADMMRFQAHTTTAENETAAKIANYFNKSTDQAISAYEISTYVNMRGYGYSLYISSEISKERLREEFKQYNLVWSAWTRQSDGAGHALVAYGDYWYEYPSMGTVIYSLYVWNPWYTYNERTTHTTVYYPATHSSMRFVLDYVQYGWTR